MKQIVTIHGGDAFATYETYLDFLRNRKIENVEYFKGRHDWKDTLPEALGSEYEVLLPEMPNKRNARYLEWKIWFEKLFPFLHEEVILVGHSMGACFLAKYLSEETFPNKISATFLVAGPYDQDGDRPIVEFVLPSTLADLEMQGGKIFLYHSTDDPIVNFTELAKYHAALPNATTRTFTDRGHFNQEQFPELIVDIKSF